MFVENRKGNGRSIRKTASQSHVLSDNLRMFRKIKGFTQSQLAGRLYISRSTYAYYESGKTLPSIFTVEKVAAFYGVPIEALLTPYNGNVIRVAYLLSNTNSQASILIDKIETGWQSAFDFP